VFDGKLPTPLLTDLIDERKCAIDNNCGRKLECNFNNTRVSQFILDGAPFLGKVEHFRARAFRSARLLYDKAIARFRLNV
jgi:hypothetical protein